MARNWREKILPRKKDEPSWLRSVVGGSLYRMSDIRSESAFQDIKTKIDQMRALVMDSQVSTALEYYATDATVTNTDNQIIWASPVDKKYQEVADTINELFETWKVNSYARDHILELATIGNLYIPTTDMYKTQVGTNSRRNVALDNNTTPDPIFDIVPSYKIPPETVVHLYKNGKDEGYIMNPDDSRTEYLRYPPQSIIHFSLGGLLGDYTIDVSDGLGGVDSYDIKFAKPLMDRALQPTQTLNLLEDALLLSSLSRVVKFINIACGSTEESEQRDALLAIKDAIEQQMSLNTANGDTQSFVNPQSPNNLIYIPMVNGNPAITVTDLNMSDATESDSKLLDYYQNKKLSVLGVPKEAMNFSSSEGLGGAGNVMSQRSALYANSLQRIETAYIEGWTDALNKLFIARNLSGFVGKFKLNMQPIITQLSTVTSERRDSAVNQATSIIDMLKSLGITDEKVYLEGIREALKEVFPKMSADAVTWAADVSEGGGSPNDF